MDELIRIAAIVAAGTAPTAPPPDTVVQPAPPPAVAWPGEDKFRHVAMSWAVTTFAYAAARSAQQDADAALAIALPVAAAAGVGKEIADRRRGRGFSVRDLVADALGAGAAWFLLREVR